MGLDLAGAGRERCVCRDTALVFPVSSLWCPHPTRQEIKSKAATNVGFVSCRPAEVPWPTSINHPWLLSRLQLPSCSRLWATITCSSLLG